MTRLVWKKSASTRNRRDIQPSCWAAHTSSNAEARGFKSLHQCLEARVGPQRRKVRVILHPPIVAAALLKGFFQAVKGFICFLEERIGASDVVQDWHFLWIHR